MFVMALALAVLCCPPAGARDMREMATIIKQPLEIPGGASKRMSVVFAHTDHRGVNCMHCHHNVSSEGRYVACTTCHCTPGVRARDPISMFMAFHAKDNGRSCVGCHTSLVEKSESRYGLKFRGCRPCHMSPGSRNALKIAAQNGK
ncbi:MAG: cytochrome c3 family protein [Desulfovibrio sp.]|nr:cytochrome c3 family protein [Desulfovibrio sp.]